MTLPHAVAFDLGSRYARIAVAASGGALPRPAALAHDVPGEGLELSAAVRRDPVTALREAYAAYRTRYGSPQQVVVVLPQRHRGTYAGRLTDALTGAGGPRARVVGVPYALLALLRFAAPASLPAGDVLVCDAGARSASAARCTAGDRSVLLHAVTEAGGPGGSLGAALDSALLTAAGLADGDAAHRGLAAARRADPGGRRLAMAVRHAVRRPDPFDDTPVHEVDGHDVPAGAVRTALPPLADAVLDALTRAAGTGRPPVLLAGGLARLVPLTDRVAEHHRLLELPADADPAYAAATGGALVAAGLIDAADRFPYAVRVGTHRRAAGRLHADALQLAAPGTLEAGGDTVFAAAPDGRPAEIRADPAARRPLSVEVVADDGRALALPDVTLPAGVPDALCRVGIRVAADGTAALVLRPAAAGPADPTEVPLGPLPVPPET
ncbi:hypothetical protein SRB5_51100 [Streptomyces sp. RB5]|uniref:Hsp70 family protein n=1 Tax=Streptomyces smaragdinus TaxID=2585196 RepID=A0A7K0CQ99_9ACTN|nr:hypothetical protein [Streptomyces smaragdinus]MQY14934.1 hypothetical protein [Streptomyces smaragdinus]